MSVGNFYWEVCFLEEWSGNSLRQGPMAAVLSVYHPSLSIPHANALSQLLLIQLEETPQSFPTPSVDCVLEKASSRRRLCVAHKDTGFIRSA